ncbi:MAG: hypothetical protein K2I76_03320 [Malacoplasma sp.]|nr:hypothetical protein [Malacoplasma sp.]
MKIINLDKLQLFSFFYSKEYTNIVNKKFDWEDFWTRVNKSFKHIISFLNANKSLNTKIGLGCHQSMEKWDILIEKIIKSHYPDIYDWIIEKSEKYVDKEILWQIHVGKESSKEVIHFLYFKENENNLIYPLILDMNHCIWKVNDDKPYRYKYSKQWKEWDFSQEENEIKKVMIKGII